jgi:hypothetical protein
VVLTLIDDIESRRSEVVSKGVALLHTLMDDIQDAKYTTSQGDDSFALGEILKSLRRHGLQILSTAMKSSNNISLGTLVEVTQEVETRLRRFNETSLILDKGNETSVITQQPTPDASPELRGRVSSHAAKDRSGAEGAVEQLRRDLEALSGGIVGLELEDGRGYCLY